MEQPTEDGDRAEVERARAGDRRAFGVLVRRHQDRLFRFLLRLCGQREEAMDLTQDTFLKAWRALPEWQAQARFATWLFQIGRNAALDNLRRRQIVTWVPLADEDGEAPLPAATTPLPEDWLCARQRLGRLERAFADLPPEQREVLHLREIENLSYAELAATLGVELGTVKSRLARARAELLARFHQHAGETPDA